MQSERTVARRDRRIGLSAPVDTAGRADRPTMTPEPRQDIVDGGYWLRRPGPNAELVVAFTGAVAPEAIEAVGMMAEDRRDVGLLG